MQGPAEKREAVDPRRPDPRDVRILDGAAEPKQTPTEANQGQEHRWTR
jgi:hypothetical protein